jgi:hypothetical protein
VILQIQDTTVPRRKLFKDFVLTKEKSYCNELGGSIHNGSLFPFQKVNTLQLNVISHSPNTRASTLNDVPHETPSTGPLLVISQHKLSFLQSGSFQTHVLLSQFPNINSVFQPTGVRSQTRASTLGDFQTRTDYKSIEVRRQQSRDHRNVSVSTVVYISMLRISPLNCCVAMEIQLLTCNNMMSVWGLNILLGNPSQALYRWQQFQNHQHILPQHYWYYNHLRQQYCMNCKQVILLEK